MYLIIWKEICTFLRGLKQQIEIKGAEFFGNVVLETVEALSLPN